MESGKRRNGSKRDGREHRTRKRDGSHNGEHAGQERKRGRISSKTIRNSTEDGEVQEEKLRKRRRTRRRRKKHRNKNGERIRIKKMKKLWNGGRKIKRRKKSGGCKEEVTEDQQGHK